MELKTYIAKDIETTSSLRALAEKSDWQDKP